MKDKKVLMEAPKEVGTMMEKSEMDEKPLDMSMVR